MNIAFTPVLKFFSAQPPVQWFELINIPHAPQPLFQLLSECPPCCISSPLPAMGLRQDSLLHLRRGHP